MNLNFEDLGVIGLVNTLREAELRSWISSRRMHSLWLDGTSVSDGTSFFRQAAVDIPQPVGMTARSWNGFLDNMRSVLYEAQSTEVAFVWKNAERMIEHGLSDLIIASDLLAMLSREVYNGQSYQSVRSLYVFLLGSGNNFL